MPGAVPPQLVPQVGQLMGCPSAFAQLHRVQDKDSAELVPFDALPMQQKIFDAVEAGHNRILVVKARQVAATTACKMVLHQRWSATRHAALFAIVSLRAESATALLDDNRRWMDDPPAILRRELDTRAKGELRLADTGATLKAFTSRSSTGLRSFSPKAVLLSEFAFALDQDELLAQALSAVGDGLLMVESTANNPGDAFSRLIAGAPENGWVVLTHWWHEHPPYADPVPDDFEPTPEEKQQQDAHTSPSGSSLGGAGTSRPSARTSSGASTLPRSTIASCSGKAGGSTTRACKPCTSLRTSSWATTGAERLRGRTAMTATSWASTWAGAWAVTTRRSPSYR